MPSREFHSALALFIIRNTNSIFWKTHIYRNSSNLAILLTPIDTHVVDESVSCKISIFEFYIAVTGLCFVSQFFP